MEIASVYLNISAIRTKLVDQNVFSIRNVHAIRLVWRISAEILALAHADRMRCAMLWIIFLCVPVYLDILEIRSSAVVSNHKVSRMKTLFISIYRETNSSYISSYLIFLTLCDFSIAWNDKTRIKFLNLTSRTYEFFNFQITRYFDFQIFQISNLWINFSELNQDMICNDIQ